jgi:hypothetical protein
MHGTMRTMNGRSIRLHDRPGEKRPVRRVLAAIGFFLLTFGSASIGMGAAIALSGASSGTSGPTPNAADIAARNNAGYLEEYAPGPAADGLCWVKRPALRKTTAHSSSLRAMSWASANPS